MQQHLPAIETQGPASLRDPRRHQTQAAHQAPQQRQQGVEGEGHHGGGGADAPQQGHAQQQTKDRQAGDGLHNTGGTQHQPGQPGPFLDQHPQRQGDCQGQGYRQGHQQ